MENLLCADPENDHLHDCTAWPMWIEGLSPRNQHTASDIEVILGSRMREMSHTSQVSPPTT